MPVATLLILPMSSAYTSYQCFVLFWFANQLMSSQDDSSEEFIGEWAEKRGIRDQLVIATKVGYLV